MAAEREVGVVSHGIIYRLLDQLWEMMESRLPKELVEKSAGRLSVKQVRGRGTVGGGRPLMPLAQVFPITVRTNKQQHVAGCEVKSGVINAKALFKVLRGDEVRRVRVLAGPAPPSAVR